jgi:hypothetical protein
MRKPGFTAFALSAGAVGWSVLLLAAAFFYPVYGTATEVSVGAAPPELPDTIVGVNGYGALIPMTIPLVLCVVVFFALRRACTTHSERARSVALTLACVLGFFALISGFSIGLFVVPAALAAILATVVTPVDRPVH